MWSNYHLEKYLKRNAHRFEVMKPYIRQHDKIVDLAIGAGGYYHQIDIKEVVGVDLDGVLLGRTKEINNKIKTIKGDVRNTGLPDKYFSLVVLSQIIEHLKDYKPLIKEAKRICKDDGYFLIGLPINHPSPVHFYPKWTEKDVRKLCEKFGDLLELQTTDGNLDKSGKSTSSWLAYVKNNQGT